MLRTEVAIERAVSGRTWLLHMCLATCVLACSQSADPPVDTGSTADDAPLRIRDTTGAQFEFAAADSNMVRSLEGLTTECSGRQFTEFRFVSGSTGLALVCSIDPRTNAPAEFMCRPVACDAQAKCPADFGCDQGLCQCQASGCRSLDAGGRIHSFELTARCLAATARFARCFDSFRDPSWAKLNDAVLTKCDSEGLCTVPDECR